MIAIYKVEQGERLILINSHEHHIKNLYFDYVYGYCTHGYLVLFKKYNLYFFKLNDNKDDLEDFNV